MWGANSTGQLGQGNTTATSSPVQVGSLTTWSVLNCSNDSTHAIKTDGTLWGWGSGALGRLGDGTGVNKSSPVQIGSETDFVNVTGGRNTIFVLRDIE